MAEATEQHATGRIEVDSYEPKPSDESTDGPALVEVDVCETFIGDIEGEGAPGARVVEAIPPFASAIAAGSLRYDRGLRPSAFVAGDDTGAKRAVERLIEDLGATPVDAGPLTSARYIEPATMLLVSLAYAGEPRDIGLRLLERTSG